MKSSIFQEKSKKKLLISILSKVSQTWIDNYGMLGEVLKSLLVKLVKDSSGWIQSRTCRKGQQHRGKSKQHVWKKSAIWMKKVNRDGEFSNKVRFEKTTPPNRNIRNKKCNEINRRPSGKCHQQIQINRRKNIRNIR